MVEVSWTTQAIEDINNIAEFIAKGSEDFAAIQTQRFFDRAEILETQPFIGRVVSEQSDKSIRELILGNYRIIYKVLDKSHIDIITIHHAARAIRNNPVFKRK